MQKNLKLGRMTKADAEVKKREVLRLYDEGARDEMASTMTVELYLRG